MTTVSAVIVVRNGERFLAEALSSIAAQTRPPDEIVVVDGYSTDASRAIATAAGVRVVRQSGRGVADAYNCAVEAARGDLIAFLSHDDRWLPHKLALQVARLDAEPALDAVVCHVRHFLESPGVVPPGFRRELLATEPAAYIMETLVARREIFDRVGGFDVSLSTAEDVDWYSRARDAGILIEALPETLVEKRVHATNLSLSDASNDANLMRALRASIGRKRNSGAAR